MLYSFKSSPFLDLSSSTQYPAGFDISVEQKTEFISRMRIHLVFVSGIWKLATIINKLHFTIVSHFAALEDLDNNLQVGIHNIMIKQWIMTLIVMWGKQKELPLALGAKIKICNQFQLRVYSCFFFFLKNLFFHIGKSNFNIFLISCN